MMTDPLHAARRAGAEFGLNLLAAIPVSRYDQQAPPTMRAANISPKARSIILIGNGGHDFWAAFTTYAVDHPGWLARDHPLDDFTRAIIENQMLPVLHSTGAVCIPAYPFLGTGPALNFMLLAQLAGLAGPSLIGVVVNPDYGPWIAFRAALLIDAEIDAPGPALAFDPCPSCATRSCMTACPAGAVTFPAGWDIPQCIRHRVEVEADCAPRCHARAGCVLGPAHRYTDDELAYHQSRALRAIRPYYEAHLSPSSGKPTSD
jgi:epoxyqueuosine reductase